MKLIWPYLRDYKNHLDPRILGLVTGWTALLIFLNYQYGLETWLTTHPALPGAGVSGRILLFTASFGLPYLMTCWIKKETYWRNPSFLFLFVFAVVLFSFKSGFGPPASWILPGERTNYWGYVLYWPARLLLIGLGLALVYKKEYPRFFGLSLQQQDFRPYFWMLLIMIPLIAFASTQGDFLSMYPKMKMILPYLEGDAYAGWKKIGFELSYGSDFIGIEVFFRGFLVFAFVRWAGKDAILPMACFYCSIHFGKPLFECISSFGGGLLLGIISYHTRSVVGGLIVHLGIAWMMEAGAYVGQWFR